ncbi:MAG: class I SAM-dependent methyltransferase [Deltaproteobacteria bacterium]|nr:class I SAM-dependent methyltransferase [Deltaproteobacteria bacterium]
MIQEKQYATISYYDQHAQSLVLSYENADMRDVHADLRSFFAPGGRLLECGFGSGRDAAYMFAQGFEVTAIDSSLRMLRQVETLHPELVGRLKQMSFPEGLQSFPPESFDGVFSIATAMHLPAAQVPVFFERVKDLLANAGKFFVSVCTARDGLDGSGCDRQGRFFLIRDNDWWFAALRESGFSIDDWQENADGLGRDEVRWLTVKAARLSDRAS